MRVLGIDPGSTVTGYGVVEARGSGVALVASGTIEAPRRDPLPQRLKRIHDSLLDVIDQWAPDQMAVEGLFFAQNPRTTLALGQTRGVVLLGAAAAELPVFEYSPMEVKQAVVGFGRATKEQVQEMVRRLLGLRSPVSADASDALGVALCHLHACRLAQRLRGAR